MTATVFSGKLASRARLFCLVGALAAVSMTGRSASAQPNVDGVWGPLTNWPIIAVHAVMTPDGRVLTYGTRTSGQQTGFFNYDVWDPSAGLGGGHAPFSNLSGTDIFCSSQVIMPHNGDILISGGDNWTGSSTTNTGNNNSNVFDPSTNSLTRMSNMNRQRWYSSSTVLVNGDIYIQGGNGGGDRPEVRQQNGTFRLLTGANTSDFSATFPHNWIAPDGRVFGFDAEGQMYYVNANGTGTLSAQAQFSSANAGSGSSAAMFRPGRILQFGGNSSGAIVIDINGPQPVVTPTDAMSSQRFWVTGTVLPNGTVLATGGSRVDNQLVDENNSAEIWDPATGTWHAGTEGAVARLYHSNALLMQDGTVLVTGGGAPGPLDNRNAELYSPPYLFNSTGGAAVRPQIVNATTSADVGTTLNIEVNTTDISRVTLVKTGSTTHSVNMDQRFVELPFTRSATTVTAVLPARASDTPPGMYHLFVLNAAGTPSRSRLLQINIDLTPNTAVDFTPTIGGTGGNDYQLSCNADETLVGVHGRFQTVINQIGPQCIRVDQFGRWIGNPVQRPVTGTTATGTAFNKVCPRDFAMSGFQGRSGTTVNQLELQCRALTAFGGLTGTGTLLGPDGGTGGTAQPLQACGTENPVYALYGTSGTQVNSFGVLCRTAVITPISTNSTPVVVNPGAQTSVAGTAVTLQIFATDGDNDPLEYTASGLPAGLAINATTGLISGVPTTPGTTQTIVTVDDGTQTALAAFNWTVTGSPLLTVQPMPQQPPRLAGTPVTYTATASGGTNVRYKWAFDDGTPETPYSPSASVTHTFASPGIYFLTLTVNDDLNVPSVQTFLQMVHLPLTPTPPRSSSTVAYETRSPANSRVWLVNQDNDTVSVFDAVTNSKAAEIVVGAAPRSVAIAPDGRIWVVNRDSASISIVSPSTLTVAQTVTLARASQPYGVVFSPVTNQAFVALSAAGRLVKLNASTGAQVASLDVGPEPRHLAISGDSTKVYVSRFITPRQPGEETATVASQVGGIDTGGEVIVVDSASLLVTSTVTLRHSNRPDSENQGSGVPNYLGAPVVSPDGTIAMVPSKQDNIARGTLRSGSNLSFQNTVRAITSRIDLTAAAEDYPRRIDHDNSSLASAVAYDPYGIYLFVALETSREVAVVDVHDGVELFRFAVGRAPQALAVSPNGDRLYVNNFMDRSVSVFDLNPLKNTGQWNVPLIGALASVAVEKLPATVLAGKQFFYDAKDPRLSRDSYMSCASCHNDGGQDGRVWDLTGMGEGLRNTINLRGPGAGHGRLHWTGNFDEVQDFEGQIRALAGGLGLMSDTAFNTGTRNQPLGDPKTGVSADLDALAAYVASLQAFPPSPFRTAGGALSTNAEAGRVIFGTASCASCHSGSPFTNSSTNTLVDVGTIKPTSGQRLGGPLTGLDTPTLCSAWQTSPYLHDGSATSLTDAISAHANVSLNAGDLALVAAYVREIDASTVPDCAPPPVPGTPFAFARSGSALSDGGGTTLSVSLTGVQAGSLLVAFVKWEGGTTPVTLSDGTSSFTADTQNSGAGGELHGRFYYLLSSARSGSVTYTATWTEARPYQRMFVYEYTQSGGIVTFDASNRATGNSGSLNSGTLTTTGTDEVVFGAYGEYDASTTANEQINGVAADQVVRTGFASMWSKRFTAPFTGAATATGNSSTWIGNVIAFKRGGGAPNTSPTIANISDRSTLEDTATGAISFTVGDGETAAGSLTLSGTSSNASVVTSGGIAFGGTGANRTVSVTPVANASGTATITVTVSDGSLTASDTFVLTVTAVNDPPTIGSVANQTTAGGVAVGPLPVTVGDLETAPASLTLSASSSDLTLVPVANIVFGGTGANRTVTVTPATGSTGTALVTLTVNDGTGTAATSFNVTVTASNTAPTISNIADRSTLEDTATGAVAFTVGDGETAAGSLTLSGASSNQSVVANGGIAFGGSGANRTVSVAPVANANGTATITVTVSDGSLTASDTFVLTVTAVNDPPTIGSVANQTTNLGTGVGPLALTVGDVETAAGSLTLSASSSNPTLVPVGNIVLGGTGANRTVSATPAAGLTGVATITLTVSDGTDTASTSFTLTVTSTPSTPLAFAHSGGAFADGGGTTLSVPLTGVQAGSLLVAYVKWEGAAGTATVSDGTSTFTADTMNNAANGDLHGQFFYLLSSSRSGNVTYTATWNPASAYRKLIVYEYTQSGGTVTLDASNRATATSGSLNSGAITTTGTDEVVFGAYGEYAASDTTNEQIGGVAADQVVRASFASMWSKRFTAPFTGAATATGNSPEWIGSVIAFKRGGAAPNTAPTIANIADRSTAEDTGTGPVGFTVGDAETAVGSLTVSGVSSNQSVVANGGIAFGGTGANRTVSVTPVANASGTATITVTVSDGSLTASDTFVLTVTAVNDLPTIGSVANQTTAGGVAVGPLPVTVGDLETAPASLTLSASSSDLALVPVANIVFGGTGANRTVTVTPATGSTGTALITLTVNDGTGTAATSFNVTVTASNTAPTISNIADRSTVEDTGTGAVAFAVGDGETAAGSLTLSGASSNQSVVANGGIAFGGSGANRTVSVTPVANASGTATITVTVSDGSLTASDTFVLTVTAINDLPTIGSVANQTTPAGVAIGPLPVTVGDVETAPGSLTLSASSSNTTLVPVANIVFGGAGANRTVTVTPAAGSSGAALVTLSVNDGTDTVATSFNVTVTVSNTAPTISNIADRSTPEDTATGAVAITVGDGETAAGSLTLSGASSNQSVVANGGIAFGGSGANRTVSVTPVANASGTATITVTVSDGSLTASDTFVLTVTAVNDSPTVSSVANQTTNVATAVGPLAFTVGDVETAAGSLTLSGGSSNTTLVPVANIVFGGTGANRTVTVTPAAGASGTALITLTVNDGTTPASTTFTLTVTSTPSTPLTFARNGAVFTDSGSTTLSVQLTGVQAGSLIVAYVKWEGGTTPVTLSDGTSSFTADTQNSGAGGELHGRFYYLLSSAASGTVTYTATWGEARPYQRMVVYEYTQSGGVVTLDASNRATATTGSLNSGAITTTGTDEVVFGAYGEYDARTTANEQINGVAADQILRTGGYASMWSKRFTAPFTGAATATGNSDEWIGNVIAFKRTP